MARFPVTDQECLEEMMKAIPLLARICQGLHLLEQASDVKEAEMWIKTIEYAKEELSRTTSFSGGSPVRQAIREGLGDYARVQKKCIEFGLV